MARQKTPLKVASFIDPNIYLFIYEIFLYTYRKFPNNDEAPEYFAKMISSQFSEEMDSNLN